MIDIFVSDMAFRMVARGGLDCVAIGRIGNIMPYSRISLIKPRKGKFNPASNKFVSSVNASSHVPVVATVLEVRGERKWWIVLLALWAFLPSAIFFFFFKIRKERREEGQKPD